MAPTTDFTAPLPFFYHPASERLLYVAHGPSPLICQGPVMRDATHPFGTSTGVSSLAEDPVRRSLADTVVFDEPGALEETLVLWRDFCDAVSEHLHEGEAVEPALAKTWVLVDAQDIDLQDAATETGSP